MVMKEGYVVLRFWNDVQYCGLDIHLWSSFEKQNSLKAALLIALGSASETSSSYRVIAGGMFGVVNWKTDTRKRGPRRTLGKKDPQGEADDTVMDVMLEENMKFVPKDGTVLVV